MAVDIEERLKAFKAYFDKYGFSEFEKLMGVSVEEFKDTYVKYKEFVQDYYDNYVPESDTLYPLVAEICPYIELDFITALESLRSLVRYPAVSVFEGEYYATSERPKIDFLECEEVMRRLLELYKLNENIFEEDKRLSKLKVNEPTNIGSQDSVEVDDEDKMDFPF